MYGGWQAYRTFASVYEADLAPREAAPAVVIHVHVAALRRSPGGVHHQGAGMAGASPGWDGMSDRTRSAPAMEPDAAPRLILFQGSAPTGR